MSSLRNAVKRVTHKERSQPQSRSHLGLLEKSKDYRLRSKDYHNKQSRLSAMRQKAANRNPDEYYFAMTKGKVDGMRQEMIEKGLGDDAVRIMKDQDLAYVRMQRLMDGRKVEKLQSSLHYLEGKIVGKKRKHTLFIEGEEKDVEDFNVAKHFDTIPELMGRSFNRPRIEALERDAM
ncbi:predicted protein, partial [Thalassiosira pseudonana CCMP1335]